MVFEVSGSCSLVPNKKHCSLNFVALVSFVSLLVWLQKLRRRDWRAVEKVRGWHRSLVYKVYGVTYCTSLMYIIYGIPLYFLVKKLVAAFPTILIHVF